MPISAPKISFDAEDFPPPSYFKTTQQHPQQQQLLLDDDVETQPLINGEESGRSKQLINPAKALEKWKDLDEIPTFRPGAPIHPSPSAASTTANAFPLPPPQQQFVQPPQPTMVPMVPNLALAPLIGPRIPLTATMGFPPPLRGLPTPSGPLPVIHAPRIPSLAFRPVRPLPPGVRLPLPFFQRGRGSNFPPGYRANITHLNTGIGPPVPAIVLKKRRKKKTRKILKPEEESESLLSNTAESAAAAANEVDGEQKKAGKSGENKDDNNSTIAESKLREGQQESDSCRNSEEKDSEEFAMLSSRLRSEPDLMRISTIIDRGDGSSVLDALDLIQPLKAATSCPHLPDQQFFTFNDTDDEFTFEDDELLSSPAVFLAIKNSLKPESALSDDLKKLDREMALKCGLPPPPKELSPELTSDLYDEQAAFDRLLSSCLQENQAANDHNSSSSLFNRTLHDEFEENAIFHAQDVLFNGAEEANHCNAGNNPFGAAAAQQQTAIVHTSRGQIKTCLLNNNHTQVHDKETRAMLDTLKHNSERRHSFDDEQDAFDKAWLPAFAKKWQRISTSDSAIPLHVPKKSCCTLM